MKNNNIVDKKMVSVLVLINDITELEKSLETLYQQTLRLNNFEIVLISEDRGNYRLIEKLIQDKKNIVFLKDVKSFFPIKGYINKLNGQYVYFLKSSDYLDPITLEILMIDALDNNSDLVTTGFFEIDEKDEIVEEIDNGSTIRSFKLKLIKRILDLDFRPKLENLLIKKSLLKKVQNSSSEQEIFLKTFLFSRRPIYHSDFLYYRCPTKKFLNHEDFSVLLRALLDYQSILVDNVSLGFLRRSIPSLAVGLRKIISEYLELLKSDIGNKERHLFYKRLFAQIKKNSTLKNAFYVDKNYKDLSTRFFEIFISNNNLDNACKMFDSLLIEREYKVEDIVEEDNLIKINNSLSKKEPSIGFRIYDLFKRVVTHSGGLSGKIKYLIKRINKFVSKKKLKNNIVKPVKLGDVKTGKQSDFTKIPVTIYCDADYHLRNAVHIARFLNKKDINSLIVNMSSCLDGGRRAVTLVELDDYSDLDIKNYDRRNLDEIYEPKNGIALFFNDWGMSNKRIRNLRRKGVITIGINEGVNDFLKLSEGFTSKVSPYRTCEYVILPGQFDKQFFRDRSEKCFVAGLPMINKLYNESVKMPTKPLAVINVNFTYGILTHKRDLFIKTAIEGCKKANIDYIITQHPMDYSDLSEYNLSSEDMYDTIRRSSIFISRFSGAIIEALAMGKPCVYHNPHNEQVIKFQEPMGAYSVSKSSDSLAKAIKYELERSFTTSVREYSREFMEYHANIGDEEEPSEKISVIVKRLLEERYN
jgi:hypothetical protein